jgi:hypothetical protein
MNGSSVSVDRCDTHVVRPSCCARCIVSIVPVTVPIWLILMTTPLAS